MTATAVDASGSVRDRLVDAVGDDDLLVYERSPVALFRLIAGGGALAAVALLTEALPSAHRGLEADVRDLTGSWGGNLADLADAIAAAAGVVAVVAAVVAARLARRDRHHLTIAVAAVLSSLVVVVAGRAGGNTPGDVVAEEWTLLAAVVGMAVLSASVTVLAEAPTRWVTTTIATAVVVGSISADVSVGSRLEALLAGVCLGALSALVAGTPSHPLSRAELGDGLARARLPVARIEPHRGDARGSLPWLATLETGRDVFVKVAVREHHTADLLFRLWRRVRLRDVPEERTAGSLRRAIEHEAFVAERAARGGVRTPAVLGVGTLAGDRGAFAVFEVVAARTMAEVGSDLPDSALRAAWSQLRALHRAGIAHRDLRAANVLVDDGGEPWVIDFGFAELSADARSLHGDVVELLASTAALVGVDRAVDAAVAVLGPAEMEDALPWVQPLATSAATRTALGRRGFDELRSRLRERLGVAEPEIPQLARVRLRTVLAAAALGIGVWTLLPQATANVEWGKVLDGNPGWFAVAIAASVATYLGAAMSLRGAVPQSVPLATTLEAQLASSFTNRVTPAKVGGMALNLRFLVKQGIDHATAATGIAVSTMAGTAVHLVLSVAALAWAGDVGGASVSMPSGRTLAVTGAILAAVLGATVVVPPLRRWMTRSAVPSLRRSWRSFLEVIRDPRNLAALGAGSALVTLGNIVAFVAALAAFGEHPPIATVAVVYLAGSALASAAPTPGGLGATEAALVAGLSIAGLAERTAVPAVLLFRVATFWLPILPGWLAFVHLQRRGDL